MLVFLKIFSILQFWRSLLAACSCCDSRCSSNFNIFLLLYQHKIVPYCFPWAILPEFVLNCYIGFYFGWNHCFVVSVVSIFLLF